ncbi:recombination protein RecR [Luminiphilus syltensis NOR5-1B]|uniref:Recombination protein RecR n=1 Tax=Luminiphilus syltensis NOR5-1B TaxID=565045 RepID=B8KYG4_9GAMM|nr:recombination mediator RecR [Luminiphilus syltensis]EED36593.1 recombination protein RecR [Luminiphilus syltensis NOR5-1B]
MKLSPSIEALIEALRCLPGVGPKSAQRMTLTLLERDREGAALLAQALTTALERVGRCQRCRNFTELPVCEICADPRRDQALLCVVETPADVMAIEHSGSYRGVFFVLMGHLSPIDGIGPEEIGLTELASRFHEGDLAEVILATNPTVEGETTAYYIAQQARSAGVTISKIAHGVPLGGELEFTDATTLAHALSGRTRVAEQ